MSYAADSKAPQGGEIHEPTGPVTSDSLAAESIQSGGGFSENPGGALEQRGSSSTFNTTDTTNATLLAPARDGAQREQDSDRALGADERGTAGGAKLSTLDDPAFTGTLSDQGYRGGPADTYGTSAGDAYSGATGDSFGSGTGAGVSSGPDPSAISSGGGSDQTYSDGRDAPNYAGIISGAIYSEGQYKPKGDNLTEGDIPETKTFTGNIGGSKDPGRLAEQKFEQINAETTVTAGGLKYAGDGQDSSQGGQYDVLQNERA